jgi:hypothetical protein
VFCSACVRSSKQLCVLANMAEVVLLLVLCFNLEAKIQSETEQPALISIVLDLYYGGPVFESWLGLCQS